MITPRDLALKALTTPQQKQGKRMFDFGHSSAKGSSLHGDDDHGDDSDEEVLRIN